MSQHEKKDEWEAGLNRQQRRARLRSAVHKQHMADLESVRQIEAAQRRVEAKGLKWLK